MYVSKNYRSHSNSSKELFRIPAKGSVCDDISPMMSVLGW